MKDRLILPLHFHDNSFITNKWLINFFSEIEQARKYLGNPDFSGKLCSSVFLEPSITSEISFTMALARMNINNVIYRSMNIEDTYTNPDNMLIRFELFGSDLIILRSNNLKLYQVLNKMQIPTINAGCSKLGDPCETLQDLYTMWRKYRMIDNLSMLVIGDLVNSWAIDSTLELFRFLDLDYERIYLSDYTTLADFLTAVEKKGCKANVIYLLNDKSDHFQENTLIENVSHSSNNNFQTFGRIFKKLKSNNTLFINSGSKRLHKWFDKPVFKELLEMEKTRLRNGNLVRIFIIRRMFEIYGNNS